MRRPRQKCNAPARFTVHWSRDATDPLIHIKLGCNLHRPAIWIAKPSLCKYNSVAVSVTLHRSPFLLLLLSLSLSLDAKHTTSLSLSLSVRGSNTHPLCPSSSSNGKGTAIPSSLLFPPKRSIAWSIPALVNRRSLRFWSDVSIRRIGWWNFSIYLLERFILGWCFDINIQFYYDLIDRRS